MLDHGVYHMIDGLHLMTFVDKEANAVFQIFDLIFCENCREILHDIFENGRLAFKLVFAGNNQELGPLCILD